MGKRSLEVLENGHDGGDSTKKIKKSKQESESLADDTLNETIESEPVPTSIPKTRRDLMELPYDNKLDFVSVIAKPMASKKLAKKLFKLMRKAGKISRKTLLCIGLKDVQLRLRKGDRGLVVFAGDVTPIEIMCHLPAVCEDKDIPYVYVPFRTDISSAIGIRRPALMVMIKKSDDYSDLYDECEAKIKELPLPTSAES